MSGHLYAVLIGNGTFDQSQLRNLRCPGHDVETLGEVLASSQHGAYIVNKIVDSTHDVVRKEIYRRLKQAAQEDLVLIYYSGHGKLDDDGNLYLATKDTDVEALPPTSVSMLDVKKYAQDSSASKIVVILDCCFSGAVKKLYKGEAADQASQAMRSLEGRGTFYLTASTDIELAEEKEGDEFSLLTKHIITGIRGGKADLNDDGRVSFQELSAYVQVEVPKEGKQRPRVWSMDASGDVTIAFTGKPPYSERKKTITRKVFDLANRDLLNEEDVATLLKLIGESQSGEADSEGFQSQRVVESLYSKVNNDGGFVRQAILLATLVTQPDQTQAVAQAERERVEKKRQAQEQAMRERHARPNQERMEAVEGLRAAEARLEQEKQAQSRVEQERLEREKQQQAAQERLERETQARNQAEQEAAQRKRPEEKPSDSNYDPTYYSPQRIAERVREAAKKAAAAQREQEERKQAAGIAQQQREEAEQPESGKAIEPDTVLDSIAKGVVLPSVGAAFAWACSFVIWIMIYSAAVDNGLNTSLTLATLAWITFILIGGAGCSAVYQLNRGVPREAFLFGGSLSGFFLALVLFIGSFEVSDPIANILKLGVLGGGLGWLLGRTLQQMDLQINSRHCKKIAGVWAASWAVSWTGFSISLVSLNGADFSAWKGDVKSYFLYPGFVSLRGLYPLSFAWGMMMSAASTGIIFWCLSRVGRERLIPSDEPLVTLKLNFPNR